MPSYPYGLKGIPGFKRIRSQKAPSNSAEFPTIKKGLGGLPKRRQAPPEWVLTVDITAGGQDWSVDISSGTGIYIKIDWDDGTVEYFTTTGEKNHVYSTPGRYFPRISGKFSGSGNIRFSTNSGNAARLKATSVVPFIAGLANFRETFAYTSVTSIPVDLFRYNPAVSTDGFMSTFAFCALLKSIPVDLFRYNTLNISFWQTFAYCHNITEVPADLFKYNTAATSFRNTFRSNTTLTTIPADLFRYNTNCLDFNGTFYDTPGLKSRADIFFRSGEESTRFLNKSPSFVKFLLRLSSNSEIGTAPELWNCNYGTGTPAKTMCFNGHSTSTVDNYASIPAEWL